MRVLLAMLLVLVPLPALAAPRYQCPTQVEPLVRLLLRDVTGYANRVIARSRTGTGSSVLLAGRPEFEPLPLPGNETPDPNLHQAFLTTLERENISGTAIELQQYHWLFLTRGREGWQLALLFTRTGSYPSSEPPTPPRDSSQGVLSQAIRLWLRDCNAGAIRP
jgi:hypothetical protein